MLITLDFLSFYKKTETLNIYISLSYFSVCYLNRVFFFLSLCFSCFMIILWENYSGLLLRCPFSLKKRLWRRAFTSPCKNNLLVATCFEVNNSNALLNLNCLILLLWEKSESAWRLQDLNIKYFALY